MDFSTNKHKYPSISHCENQDDAFTLSCRIRDFEMAKLICSLWPDDSIFNSLDMKFYNACIEKNVEIVNLILEIWTNHIKIPYNAYLWILTTLCRDEIFIDAAKKFYADNKNNIDPDIGCDIITQLLFIKNISIGCFEWVLSICRYDDIVCILYKIYNSREIFWPNDFIHLIRYIIEIFDIDELLIDDNHQTDFNEILYKHKSNMTKSSRKI